MLAQKGFQGGFDLLLFGFSVAGDLFFDGIGRQLVPLMLNAPLNPVRHARHLRLADHGLRKSTESGLFPHEIGVQLIVFDVWKEKGHGLEHFVELLAMGLGFGLVVDVGGLKFGENEAVFRLFDGHFAKSGAFQALISRHEPEFVGKLEGWSRFCGFLLRQGLHLLS